MCRSYSSLCAKLLLIASQGPLQWKSFLGDIIPDDAKGVGFEGVAGDGDEEESPDDVGILLRCRGALCMDFMCLIISCGFAPL